MSDDNRYHVRLTGELMGGADADRVAANLARLFKMPEEKAALLVSGKPRVVKKDAVLVDANTLISLPSQDDAQLILDHLQLVDRMEHVGVCGNDSEYPDTFCDLCQHTITQQFLECNCHPEIKWQWCGECRGAFCDSQACLCHQAADSN